ncbi:hypothetical protein HG536_0D06140 [Torulaspora globosa]|uniref:L-serine ammonia-lyase n=1 Tax=Torulaspora globosa TaxID=48254 RepID=A0A7G3ZHV5_9SACH|nr:uncharacterized protein HG536_0D06140 [Torulaspora globosa]QLL33091.1 hypothetical protein HG536_0D06140 [Torulaspora globosa]
MSHYVKTPLLKQDFSESDVRGPQFYLKCEFLQPSGSFKSRGIGYLILNEVEKAKASGSTLHVFISSGGNAGLAAAVASKAVDTNCTVVVPSTTKPHMITKIKKAGATVVIHGDHWQDADSYLRETVMKNLPAHVEPLYVHPFDDSRIWQGHSTIIDEVLEQLSQEDQSPLKVKGVISSVGGGGLYNGIVRGLERHGLADKIPLIGVETIGADAMTKSLEAGKSVRLSDIRSIATTLGASYIAQDSLDKAARYKTKCFAQKDAEAVKACFKFLNDRNVLVEPACAASLSLCYDIDTLKQILQCDLTKDDIFIVIVCGGSSMTISDLQRVADELQIR